MLEGPLHRTDPRQLRIVHCVRAPIGGIFRNVLDLAAAQTASGHLVGIVLDSLTGGDFEASKIAAAAPHLALGITRLPMPRTVNPMDLLTAWRVFQTVRALAPDILHGHGAKGGSFARLVGTLLSATQKPVARFYSPHGGTLHYAKKSLAGRVFFTVERMLERLCDGIIHVSRYEATTYLDKVGTPRCRASVIVNGLRPEEFAEVMPNMEARLFAAKEVEKDTLRAKAFVQNPAEPWPKTLNSRLWREAEIASGNGHGNARGVARIYGAFARGGSIDGVRLSSAASIEAMIKEQHNITELMQDRPYHQALGVLLNTPAALYMGPNMRSFGHHGIGGSIGFADPDARIGFSYACNKMHAVGTNGPRAARLIDALYESTKS